MERIRSLIEEHDKDPDAHQRARRNRDTDTEGSFQLVKELEKRVARLEIFKSQVTLLGGIGLIILGATASAVVLKIFGA